MFPMDFIYFGWYSSIAVICMFQIICTPPDIYDKFLYNVSGIFHLLNLGTATSV